MYIGPPSHPIQYPTTLLPLVISPLLHLTIFFLSTHLLCFGVLVLAKELKDMLISINESNPIFFIFFEILVRK